LVEELEIDNNPPLPPGTTVLSISLSHLRAGTPACGRSLITVHSIQAYGNVETVVVGSECRDIRGALRSFQERNQQNEPRQDQLCRDSYWVQMLKDEAGGDQADGEDKEGDGRQQKQIGEREGCPDYQEHDQEDEEVPLKRREWNASLGCRPRIRRGTHCVSRQNLTGVPNPVGLLSLRLGSWSSLLAHVHTCPGLGQRLGQKPAGDA
jgi:hypothetical protein